MADKAIYSVDTVTSLSGTDKVYVNTGNNIKQITKDNLCGNDISHINDSLSVLGKCKNLLKPTLGSGTGNGITYINNGNGTYTLSGTCTNTFELHFNPSLKLPYGKYKLLGTSAFQKTNKGEWIATLVGGDAFEVSESKPVLDVVAYISSGSVVNQTIKPMVTTNLNTTVDDFVPYTGDEDTLTADVAKINNQIDTIKNDVDRIAYDCGRASFGGSATTITQGGVTWYAYGVGVSFSKEYDSFPSVQLTVIVPAGTLAIANLTNVTTTGFEATIWSLAELNGGTLEYMISKK